MHNFLGGKAAKVNVRTERGQASRDSPLVPALPEHRYGPGWPASCRDGFGPAGRVKLPAERRIRVLTVLPTPLHKLKPT